MHLRQKARLRPELSPKLFQLWAQTRPEKPGLTYNSALAAITLLHFLFHFFSIPLMVVVLSQIKHRIVVVQMSSFQFTKKLLGLLF